MPTGPLLLGPGARAAAKPEKKWAGAAEAGLYFSLEAARGQPEAEKRLGAHGKGGTNPLPRQEDEESRSGRPGPEGNTRPVTEVKQQLSSDPRDSKSGSHRPSSFGPPRVGVGLSEVGGGEEAENWSSPLNRLNNTSPQDQVKKEKDAKSSGARVGINSGERNVSRGRLRGSRLKPLSTASCRGKPLREGSGGGIADSSGRETVLGKASQSLVGPPRALDAGQLLICSPPAESMKPPSHRQATVHAPGVPGPPAGASGGRVNAKMQVYSGLQACRQPRGW
ncbi:hypothetical protein AAY473_040677 [Plecturocebus cupreus]